MSSNNANEKQKLIEFVENYSNLKENSKELSRQFRQLSLIFHPDKQPRNNPIIMTSLTLLRDTKNQMPDMVDNLHPKTPHFDEKKMIDYR